MNKADIRSRAKLIIGRNINGMDSVLDNLIDTTVELFGSVISNIWDEEEWEHEITLSEVSSKVDSWRLPDTVKHVLKATVIDKSSTEPVYFPLEIISPMDWYDIGKLDDFEVRQTSYDYSVTPPRFGDGLRLRVSGRVEREGIPRFIARIGTNVFVYPRPSRREVGFLLRILTAVKPANLVLDTDSNTITDRYPFAMIWYVAGLYWMHLGDIQRAQMNLQTASLLMTSFATGEEISKLIGIAFKVTRNA